MWSSPPTAARPTSHRQRALLVLGCAAALLCQPLATAAQNRTATNPVVVLLGFASLPLGQAAQTLQASGEFTVRVNADVDSADMVLFVVHAPDGPMRPGLDQIAVRAGQKAARAAILLTGAEPLAPELLQLVVLETREVLGGYVGEARANRLELLKMPDVELPAKLKALLFLPPIDIVLDAPVQ